MRTFFFGGLWLASAAWSFAQDEPPVCLDDRLKIELFAEQPQLVTPTGIDVDHLGRVFVIESNTHFPPDGYEGHPTDRVLILENTDENPQADKITVFADGLKFTMSVAVQPVWLDLSGGRKPPDDAQPGGLRPPLRVFVATRSEILLLTDTDGDNKADETKRLVHLETAGNYPHNGLAGFAFDALGNMVFGFGENLGADYKIIGSDGTTLSGGGEGGNVYRCKPDGSKLERWATGFWNPHASCFDAFGRLFTVDNDPDSRPPCRLLHIIPGGDYGYRFRNGRKGTHPFTSWNGEIPGTLPMVAGTGEGPSGIVCYENDGFPEDYLGTLLVGSWGDHRIDQFVLEPKGASFTSKAKPIVKGGENFRPVGLAVAPDGSLYFSDWVLKDYKLHGKGRVWRVCAKDKPKRKVIDLSTIASLLATDEMEELLESPRIDVRRVAAQTLAATPEYAGDFRLILRDTVAPARARIESLWAMSEVPLTVADFHLEPTADPEDAIFGMQFDEVLVAAVPLFGTPQFSWQGVDVPDTAYVVHPDAHPPSRSYFISQVKVATSLASSEWFVSEYVRVPLDEDELELPDIYCDPFRISALTHSGAGIYQFEERVPERLRVLAIIFARIEDPRDSVSCRLGLTDESPLVRRVAVQWVGEERFDKLRWLVEVFLANPTTTPDLFLACLATLQLLDGQPASEFEKNPPTQYIAAMVKDAGRPQALRATALRMLPANTPELDAPLLTELLSSHDDNLRLEAVRTLASSPLSEARGMLLPIAANSQATIEMRAEALAGLCHGPHEAPLPGDVEALLLRYARGDVDIDEQSLSDASQKRRAISTLQLEALRSLRGRAKEGSKIRKEIPKDGETASEVETLREAIEIVLTGKSNSNSQPSTLDPQPSDLAAGRRTFFHHQGPLCAKCHMVQGRGGQVGPDLTVIARTMDREKLLASILEPSKEIAPQFTTWVIETTAGKTHTGFILEDNRTGQIKLGAPTGEVIVVDEHDIETREPSKSSVMPEKLHERMTSQELQDLLAFLESLK